MNKEYIWGGHTYRIAEEDLRMYPGAVPVEEKARVKAPDNKAKTAPANKGKKSKEK